MHAASNPVVDRKWLEMFSHQSRTWPETCLRRGMRGVSTRPNPSISHQGRSARAISVLALASVVVVTVGRASSLAAPGPATTLYVDQTNPDCSNGGVGSAIRPFCTIGAAATRAVGGQTVVVAAGTYTEDVTPSNSGGSSAPIVFAVVPGAVVTVTGRTNGFTLSNKSWITVQGFNVTGTIRDGFNVSGSANITLAGNHVSYCGQPVSGSTASGIRLSATTNSLIARNTVDHNSDFGIFLTNGTAGVTVEGNDISYNARGFQRAAAGIHVYASSGNVLDGNVSHDNEDSGIDCAGGANDNLIRNNLSYHNGDHGIGVFGSTSVRIIANSVYKNVTAGIAIYGSANGTMLANNISVDNGIKSPRTTGNIRVDSTSTTGTTLDYDLTFLHEASSVIVWGTATYYSLAAFVADTGHELHGIEADPLWSSPDAGDLHLLEGSPAIDSANSGASGQTEVDGGGNPRVDDPTTADTGTGPRPDDDRGGLEFQPNGACGHAGAAGCPVTQEICGDCIDNDGDGLVDYEDPDCCGQASLLGLQRMRVRSAGSKGRRLALKALYLRSVRPGFDPTTQDTTVQIADSHGELFCKTIAAAKWKRRDGGHAFLFRDPQGRFAGGLAGGRFRVKRNGKVIFSTRGRKTMEMRATKDRTLSLAVRIGDLCMQTTAALRSNRKGLVFP